MIKNTAILALSLTISACTNIKLNSNVDDYFIASHVARDDLYEFYSGQQATESGAILLGRIEGMSCMASQDGRRIDIDISKMKNEAIELLKQDAISRGANAFLVEQCQSFTNAGYGCDRAFLCTGQSYDYE
ncbi:hypothetical protein NQT69_13545 [Pseudoalteromonas shioyasakiensis]|uniref:hypothetical protein n=1 Tax=Pseudoalteromonas shioyasakiensis TaxID=1190813 RepID=UPI002117A58A|nr:hypothetical protein [Pseudoalteromonas shioyasakiensis]MCQ8879031.1 hypothetical protein [Pseudoalteromonas shioyasakiensis]